MKMLVVAILIFAIISGACIVYDIYINKITEKMLDDIESIHSSVKDGDYLSAKNTFIKLKKYWESKDTFLQLETEHNELDIINEQFAVLSANFDHNEYDEFFETLYKLEYFIEHITQKKQLNLKTIL